MIREFFDLNKFHQLHPDAQIVVMHFALHDQPCVTHESFINLKAHELLRIEQNDLYIDSLIAQIKDSGIKIHVMAKPTLQMITDYIDQENLMPRCSRKEVEDFAVIFFNYYESVGWVVGKKKTPMKSWKGAVQTWFRRGYNKPAEKSKVEESVKAFMELQNLQF